MPLPVRYLFLVGEKRLSQHFRQLRLVGLSLWAVLACLIQGLEDPETLEQISGLTLDQGAKESLSLLAECLRATMDVPQKVGPEVNILIIEKVRLAVVVSQQAETIQTFYVHLHRFITFIVNLMCLIK